MSLRDKLMKLLSEEEEVPTETKQEDKSSDLLAQMEKLMDEKLAVFKKESEPVEESSEEGTKEVEDPNGDLLKQVAEMMDKKIAELPRGSAAPPATVKKQYTKEDMAELIKDYSKNKELIHQIRKEQPGILN